MNAKTSNSSIEMPGDQKPIWPLALLLVIPALWIVLTPGELNPDTYQYYAIASAYHANIATLATIGSNTVGPLLPLSVLVARFFFNPGTNLHAVTLFFHVLTVIFLTLAWAEGLYLVSRRTRDWRTLLIFSATFLLLIDWRFGDFQSLNGELFSAPLLIGLLLAAPEAGWSGRRKLTNLAVCGLLLTLQFYTKLQAYPMACFAFVFAAALRHSFTIRDGLLRVAFAGACSAVLAALPVVLGLPSQDVVAHAISYLQGAAVVAPFGIVAAGARHFLRLIATHLFGVVVTLVAAGLALYFLKPPPTLAVKRGLTQAEWFTAGMIATAILCVCMSLRFFGHYALLLLPTVPLVFDVVMARVLGTPNQRFVRTALPWLLGGVVLYQLGLAVISEPPQPQDNATVQRNADQIRALCRVDTLPVIVHGWDYRYYIALGSYPTIEGTDIIEQSGYQQRRINDYTRGLRERPHLIVDVITLFGGPLPATVDLSLGHLLGPEASRYRAATIAPGVGLYCPNTR